MAGLYSHTTRADGTTLTASIYNADHQNHITNFIPSQMDDYSSNVVEMKTQTTPGTVGSESLPTSLAGELERIRYMLATDKGRDYWYRDALYGGGPLAYSLVAEVFGRGRA